MFEKYKQWYTEFSDDQRVERLRRCASLESQFRECLKRRKELERAAGQTKDELDNASHGTSTKGSSGSWFWSRRERALDQMNADKKNNVPIEETEAAGTPLNSQDTSNSRNSSGMQSRPAMWRGTAPPTFSSKEANLNKNISDNKPKSTSGTIKPSIPSCKAEEHDLWNCRGLALGCGDCVVQLKRCFEGDLKNGSQDCKTEQVKLSKCVEKNAVLLERRRQARKNM